MLFKNYFNTGEPNLTLIFLGCMSFGILIPYIFVHWANLATFSCGAKAGAVIGFSIGFMNNSFMASADAVVNWKKFLVDVPICTVIGLGVGAVVATVNGAISKT